MIKYHAQKQLKKERAYFALGFQRDRVRDGREGTATGREAGARACSLPFRSHREGRVGTGSRLFEVINPKLLLPSTL